MRIKPFTSFALDVLRVLAAFGVVINHFAVTGLIPTLDFHFGHLLVVCFFVLSGLVIAATSDPHRTTLTRYFSLRLARLWSVALPCLALTLLLEIVGRHLAPAHHANFDRGSILIRYLMTALFINESGSWSAGPPTNSPVWSLPYEAWYYVLFGVARFVKPRPARYLLLLLAGILAGPKILLLMPAWLLGVLVWHLIKNPSMVRPWRFALLLVSLGITASILNFEPYWPQAIDGKPWFYSASYLSDFAFGCSIAGLILAIDLIWGNYPAPPKLSKLVRDLAGVSFTFYLLHYPLMIFAAGVIPSQSRTPLFLGTVLTFIAALIYGIGKVIEPQRKPFAIFLEKRLLIR